MNNPIERLEIANLASFTVHGDPSDSDSFDNPLLKRWAMVGSSAEKKLGRYLSKIKQKVNVHVFLPKAPRIKWYGIQRWRSEFDDTGITQDSSAINVIVTTYPTDSRLMPPTPWIILHLMCHTFYEEDEEYFKNLWLDFIGSVYNIPYEDYDEYVILENSFAIMEEIMTFRAARINKIVDYPEGIIELMVQAIVEGRAVLKEFPEMWEIQTEDTKFHYRVKSTEKLRKEFLLAVYKELAVHLKQSVGKYIFT